MAITLYHVGRQPNFSQYGLDQFAERYTTDSPADIASLDSSVPQRGAAHGTYSFMFVTDRRFSETPNKGCNIDIVYLGCMATSMGSPVLPPQKATSGGQVASATTNTDSTIYPAVVTNPATVTFYAITNTLTFISTDPLDASEPDDPPEITSVITWDLGPGLQPGFAYPALVTYLLSSAFVQGIIEAPPQVVPLVQGQFYQITKQKRRTLFPYAPPS